MYCFKNDRSAVWVYGFLFLVLSCGRQPEIKSLYNIDSLVNAQVNFLKSRDARLHKIASINGRRDDRIFSPADSAAWSTELDIFRKLDLINKPVNQGSYIVDDGLYDPSSNLTVKAISAIDDLPVKYVRIFYQDRLQKPRKIEALYDDQNALYKSGRILTMEFQQIDNKSILTSYSVKGGQKMIMGDSVAFLIQGEIMID
jgi:hypothetical protein